MTKLVYVDDNALDSGIVAQGAYLDEKGNLTLGQFIKDNDGVIRKVIKNGNLNPITTFYLQGASNSEQMLPKDLSKEVMSRKGGMIERELSGGLDKDKNPLPARHVVAVFTFVESRGLGQYDPRSYDCKIIKDGSVAKLEGEYIR